MGFFARLGNMISGFLNMFIGKIEEKNPAAVYEAAIQERIKTYQGLKKAISNIVFLRNKSENELEAMIKDLETVNLELEGAISTGQEEIGAMLFEKQEKLESSIAKKREELQHISKQAEDSMDQLQQFEVEIQNLKREKDEMLAKEANADAQIKIQETLSSLSVDADIQALANVRDAIEKKSAEAKVGAELADNNLDNKLANLREEGARSRARARFEAARQARLAKESGQATQATEAQSASSSDTPPPSPSGNSGGKTI